MSGARDDVDSQMYGCIDAQQSRAWEKIGMDNVMGSWLLHLNDIRFQEI